jgi:hypothetical protein
VAQLAWDLGMIWVESPKTENQGAPIFILPSVASPSPDHARPDSG